jgi:hypothetical protein
MLFQKKILNIFLVCECEKILNAMFLANAKSNFGAIFGYYMGFYGFSGKIVGFPMRISSENKIFALRILTAPFCIRKAFV